MKSKKASALNVDRPDSRTNSEEGLDEDGNPITVEAAVKMYHANKNPVFIKQPAFKNRDQVVTELMSGNRKVQKFMKESKFNQLSHFGQGMR